MNSSKAGQADLLSLSALVKADIQKRFHIGEESLFDDFFDRFWARLSKEDWSSKSVADIAGSAYGLWLSLKSAPADDKVRCFNPNFEEHGWSCNGTAIIVHHPDMPFLIDSLRLALNDIGHAVHLIKSTLLCVTRDGNGSLRVVAPVTASQAGGSALESHQNEALVLIEIDLLFDAEERRLAEQRLIDVLSDVRLVVGDYHASLALVENLIASFKAAEAADVVPSETISEAEAFLGWLVASHFTFLGASEYEFITINGERVLREKEEARLGLLKKRDAVTIDGDDSFDVMAEGSIAFHRSRDLIAFSKSSRRATVHRPVYPDYVVIKQMDKQGNVVGEIRLLGLFTYSVYGQSPSSIPFIRQKVDAIIKQAELGLNSHDGKNLIRVLDSFPRDELFQSDFETLYRNIVGIASISERRVVKVFSRTDRFQKFVSFLLYIPRDIFTTKMRMKMEKFIGDALDTQDFDSNTYFAESVLARVHTVYKVSDLDDVRFDPDVIEAGIVDIAKGWGDRLQSVLVEKHGELTGLQYYRDYQAAFPLGYQERYDAQSAAQDIDFLSSLTDDGMIAMHLFQALEQPENRLRFKVLRLREPIELSDVIPILENLGLRVIGENPFTITQIEDSVAWLHVFDLMFALPISLDVKAIAKTFEDAFAAVWHGKTENDSFNRLVLGARLQWREVALLRAYAAYMKQTLFNYSENYIADTLVSNPDITRNLVALFKTIFDPRLNQKEDACMKRIDRLNEKILADVDAIQNLNEDKILRRYHALIQATLRTNFFQKNEDKKTDESNEKPYISIKFRPQVLTDLPEPKPAFEIFVYSTRFEGVHLRTSKIARGGLRWSDRLQDYRTEVLGLVKAQQVKNAVIVPSGAKGGFVCKQLSQTASREAFMKEGIACYQTFIRGLLDITDNLVDSQLVPPKDVVCRDEPDPYLVVAADKGTATFSDIANQLSIQKGHWLGDAFASGGSQGYDHKGMGITAKGAWISVQRHFRERGLDVQSEDFSVLGIGDMSGDVFGNGMLLSEHICLVAAFNHMHIFIDPTPNAVTSFKERKRLFELGRSQWSDYDSSLISQGGGIFSRSSKSIVITPEMKNVFDIEEDKLAPTDLLQKLLQAKVDLIWNGGIGTYVKSESESHADVGDKANDGLRVNGEQLRCQVFGEGGNLGMTQLGRIEYSLAGGSCNTDFIDNAAGVDCSDHEVNIKILLDGLIQAGDMTEKQRNELLRDMTDEVSDCVLSNNYVQTGALSLAHHTASRRMGEFKRFMQFLEKHGGLDRTLEYLPSDEAFAERRKQGLTLTRPELAVLLSYAKVLLKGVLAKQDIADHAYALKFAINAFPLTLRSKFPESIFQHQLVKEIVATQLANGFVNDLGILAIQRLMDSTGESAKNLVLAYLVVSGIFDLSGFKAYLKSHDLKIPTQVQYDLTFNLVNRIKRSIRWFLKMQKSGSDIQRADPEAILSLFKSELDKMHSVLPKLLKGEIKEQWDVRIAELKALNIESPWLHKLSVPDHLFTGLSVIQVSQELKMDVTFVCRVFFAIYDALALRGFATHLAQIEVENHWQATAREGYLDDIEVQLTRLARGFVSANREALDDVDDAVTQWLDRQQSMIERLRGMMAEASGYTSPDFAMYGLAMRDLADLADVLTTT